MSNYRPQCFIRTADITVSLVFPEGTPEAHEKMVASFFHIYCTVTKNCLAGNARR